MPSMSDYRWLVVDNTAPHIRKLRRILARAGQPVVLMVHDWGCVYGYHFAMTHPERVGKRYC